MSFFGAHREAGTEILPSEGHLPPFEGATGWLNSEPLTPEGLRGRVVAVQFWTYTCVNWLRTLPYVREWAAKYSDRGPHARVRIRAERRERGRGRQGDGGRLPDRARQRLRRLGRLRQPLLAGAVHSGWAGTDPLPPLRRGRVCHVGDGRSAATPRGRRGTLRSATRVRRAPRHRGCCRLEQPENTRDLPGLWERLRLRLFRRRALRRGPRLSKAIAAGLERVGPFGPLDARRARGGARRGA